MEAANILWDTRLKSWQRWPGNECLRCFDLVLDGALTGQFSYPPEMVASLVEEHEPLLDDEQLGICRPLRLQITHREQNLEIDVQTVDRVIANPLWTSMDASRHLGIVGGTPLPSAWNPHHAPLAVVATQDNQLILYPADALSLVTS